MKGTKQFLWSSNVISVRLTDTNNYFTIAEFVVLVYMFSVVPQYEGKQDGVVVC